ncbi:aromatic amino acid:proton symporter (AAT family) [Sediminihabitans luteus]|uniref:Aromatic amino acid:proton symporter (AAT family) n=1 Tax=Sediminihabitans luteus TaxID=1138585 RepID=A0A2M9CBZ3_9CELL|nr:amino acid permease [Sediminihabitans luteus]PJJ68594.1 aromatic amino acid:proton symporter (AAT family) [Sediminihabitans luteus]GII99932.1 amino acid transporter [Sediminihabitans luteus]
MSSHQTEPAPEPAPEQREPTGDSLAHGLRARHLTMMGLGSAIGAGLFLGSGQGIAIAGPAVLVSYSIAGVLVVLLMRMLAEMATEVPSSGAFSVYAETALGRWAGFTMGWLYWFMLIMVLGVEVTGAAQIMAGWWPSVPQWVFAGVVVALFAVLNLVGVRSFGEAEFWFAAVKVLAILAFLVIGVLVVLGWLPGTEPVGTENLLGHGGFAPTGWSGIAAALLVVVFAFGGIEIVTIAAAEARDPQRAIGIATRSIVWRIVFFYLGSIAIMVLVLPWDSPALAESPFVAVLDVAGLENAARVMSVVVVVALLSAFNANVYGTSRMAYSLARRGDGPRALARVSRTEVPWVAVLLSVFFGFVSVLLNWWLPDALLEILLNAVGSALLVIWVFIAVSQLVLRPRLEAAARERGETLQLRMWLYPWLTWATLAGLAALVVLMLTDPSARAQLAATAVLTLVIFGIYLVRSRRARA